MLPPAWPRASLFPEEQSFSGKAWRIVKDKAKGPVERFAGESGDEKTLKEIFGESEDYLDRLLCEPFRPCDYSGGSRFRRSGITAGVWYGSETSRTAAIETAFYRSLEYAKPNVPFPSAAGNYIAFLVEVKAKVALDLTTGGMARYEHLWKHPTNYDHCQRLVESLRGMGGEVIRYGSVRDEGGFNIAVLSCCAFVGREPLDYQTWSIWHKPSGVHIACEDDGTGFEFVRDSSGEVDWGNPIEK